MAFDGLFAQYDRLLIFDVETTGLKCQRDQIIEFAAGAVEKSGIVAEYDELIALEPGTVIPDKIVELTHITNEMVNSRGISKQQLSRDIAALAEGKTLLIAYNANFDLCFTYFHLAKYGDPAVLQGKDKIDLLTVYKDRREYPHRLECAIKEYKLTGQVVNSHRAVDDVLATLKVMECMEKERDDLLRYVNLFGYNPNYPRPKPAIASVRYLPQSFLWDLARPLYMEGKAIE